MGLALRALGWGRRVTVVQFLKDGSNGELNPLRKLGAAVYSGKSCGKFFAQMTSEEQRETAREHHNHLQKALEVPCALLVLDEACAAWKLDLMDQELSSWYTSKDTNLNPIDSGWTNPEKQV